VGGVVVQYEVDVEIGRHGRVDGIEEAPELGGAIRGVGPWGRNRLRLSN
jgi:hypothetical protein